MHPIPKRSPKPTSAAKVNNWFASVYILMIFSVIGFMVLHNLMIFVRKLIDRRKHGGHATNGPRIVVRMTKNQRIQHFLLLFSFFTLVITGFALKFPDAATSFIFVNELGRSYVHRFAGV